MLSLALGTTGESMSFSLEERLSFLRLVKKYAGNTVTYAGITSDSYTDTLRLATHAFELGYDAVVPHLPSYFPLTESLMYRYFLQLVEAVQGPVIIYNIPITTGMSIPLPVVEGLSRHPGIIGLKDSESGEVRLQRNLEMWKDREDFRFFLGNAAYGAKGMLQGADGIVPSMANLIPEHYQAVYTYGLAGNADQAQYYHQICDEVSSCCQLGRTVVDAIPALKYMLQLAGFGTGAVTIPMQEPDDENKWKIYQALLPLMHQHQLNINLSTVPSTYAS